MKAGDLLVRLDEQRAKAALDQSAADLARVVRAVGGQFASRRQACQKIASQIAMRDKTRHDIARYRQALPSGAVSQQTLQNAMDQLASLEAELHQEPGGLPVLRGAARRADPRQDPRDRGGHGQIRRDLHRIRAPAHQGARFRLLAKRKAQIGDRVRPGDLLMQIIPLDYLWIEANPGEQHAARAARTAGEYHGRSLRQ